MVLGLLLVLLEPCKIVYLPLAGICLLIPRVEIWHKEQYWISVAAVIAVMALAIFLINNVVRLPGFRMVENIIRLEGGAAGYTIQDISQRPYQASPVYVDAGHSSDYYQLPCRAVYLGNLD